MKDEKNIVVQRDNSKTIILQDNGLRAGSLIEDAIKTLDHKQVQNIGLKAAEEAIRLQVKSHEQNLDYLAGKNTWKIILIHLVCYIKKVVPQDRILLLILKQVQVKCILKVNQERLVS